MSRSGSAGSLKGKHGLARRLFTDRFFEHFRWREIDRNAEEISQSILQPGHVQQRQWLVLDGLSPAGIRRFSAPA